LPLLRHATLLLLPHAILIGHHSAASTEALAARLSEPDLGSHELIDSLGQTVEIDPHRAASRDARRLDRHRQ
jgi:hypothetical protein